MKCDRQMLNDLCRQTNVKRMYNKISHNDEETSYRNTNVA